MGQRILVVGDGATAHADIEAGLKAEGHSVCSARSEADGFYLVNAQQFDLMVIVDDSPDAAGVELVSFVRRSNKEILILIVCAELGVEERIRCLRSGADDCLASPFEPGELHARVEALLRRGRLGRLVRLAVSDLIMDLGVRRVTRGGQSIALTVREFDLLETLMRRAHHVVRRDELARSVWNNVNRATPLDNVIDVHIGHLRKKIHARGTPLIHTARGVGFMLSDRSPG